MTSAPSREGAAVLAGEAVPAGHPRPAGSIEDVPRLMTAEGGVAAAGDRMPDAAWTLDVRDVPAGQARCGDACNVICADTERLVGHERTIAAGSDSVEARRLAVGPDRAVGWIDVLCQSSSSRWSASTVSSPTPGAPRHRGVLLLSRNAPAAIRAPAALDRLCL